MIYEADAMINGTNYEIKVAEDGTLIKKKVDNEEDEEVAKRTKKQRRRRRKRRTDSSKSHFPMSYRDAR